MEYCPAGAVKLGQQLCRADGSQVPYPRRPLPSEQKRGELMRTGDKLKGILPYAAKRATNIKFSGSEFMSKEIEVPSSC